MMNTNSGAKSAAAASSSGGGEQPLHCGKWTPEEEAYVQCLIEEFQAGYLPIREGTSLRSFLSKMLNCKPKRISKKFEGSDYNGKQVYVSQPYKLTAEEARERRDRLSTLERKFHQSVAELKSAEGGGGKGPSFDEPLDAAAARGGGMTMGGNPGGMNMGGGMPGMGGMNHPMGGMNMSGMNMGGGMNMNMNAMNMGGMNMANMNRAPSPNAHDTGSIGGNPNSGGGQQQQFLEELAFQDSMLRLRQQQAQQVNQQQQQMQAQQQQQSGQGGQGGGSGSGSNNNANAGGGGGEGTGGQGSGGNGGNNNGSYVDPILGSLALGNNAVNTTPLAASQYWRRQALLEASTHLDSLRMAQAGAIGIQRPTLEPGALRDLRMPAHLGGGGGGGGMQQGGQFDGPDGAAAAASSFDQKKRRVSDSGNNMTMQQMMMNKQQDSANASSGGGGGQGMAKRMRRDDGGAAGSTNEEQQAMLQQQMLNNNQFLR